MARTDKKYSKEDARKMIEKFKRITQERVKTGEFKVCKKHRYVYRKECPICRKEKI